MNTITSHILICVKGNQLYHLRAQKQRKITKRNKKKIEKSNMRDLWFKGIGDE